jgi:hypothetical protein
MLRWEISPFCCSSKAYSQVLAQNIRVFQRITKILDNLARGVDLDVEERLSAVDKKAQDIVQNLDRLTPQIDLLWQKLAKLDSILSGDVRASVEVRCSYRLVLFPYL